MDLGFSYLTLFSENCWNIFQIILGAALLYAGAELMVRGSSGLAGRLGISPLVIGLTVVAFGTSAPELVVAVAASLPDDSHRRRPGADSFGDVAL